MKYYTVAEISDVLRLGRTTTYKLIHSNEIPSTKIGKKILIEDTSLHNYIKKKSK